MALVSGVKGEVATHDPSPTGDEHVEAESLPPDGGDRRQHQQQQHQQRRQQEDLAVMWDFVFGCLKVYQIGVAGQVENLVGGMRERYPYPYNDGKVWDKAARNGLQRAFRRMQARVVERGQTEAQKPCWGSDPCTFASMQTFVATQNRFLRDELVTRLRLVDGPRLEKVLPVDHDGKQRAIVSQMAAGSTAWTAGQAAGQRTTVRLKIDFTTSGAEEEQQPLDDAGVAKPAVDFSDVSDGKWEAEFEGVCRAAETARVREEAAAKMAVCPIFAAEGWITAAQQHVLGWRKSVDGGGGDGGGDDHPPLLLTDSDPDSDSSSGEDGHDHGDGDNCDEGPDADVRRDGTPAAADLKGGGGSGRKRAAPDSQRGKGRKKGGTPAPLPSAVPVGRTAALPTIDEADDEADDDGNNASAPSVALGAAPAAAVAAGETTAKRAVDAAGETGCELDYRTTMRWVHNVDVGRVTARPGQVHRYFRGRLDEDVIAMVLQTFRKNVRAAVLSCADMIKDHAGVGLSIDRDDDDDGEVEAGRYGDNDDDVDAQDAPAIVSRANYLLDTGCRDQERLQSLLDKAKGKERINPVRKRLRKAIKALRQQEPFQQRQQQQQQQSMDKTKFPESGVSGPSGLVQQGNSKGADPSGKIIGKAENGKEVEQTGRAANIHPAFAPADGGYTGNMYNGRSSSWRRSIDRQEDMDVDSGSDVDGTSASSDSDGGWGGGGGGSGGDGFERMGFAAYNIADTRGKTDTKNAFSAFDSGNSAPAPTGVRDGALDGLIKQADELVANACQDTRKLDRLLHRARGKPGLDKTRKMLRKAIKDINRWKDNECIEVAGAGGVAPGITMPSAPYDASNNGDENGQEDFPKNNHNNNIGIISGGKDSGVLGISRTVEKQLERQRKTWSPGQVRQIVRCRPGVVARVIGKNGATLNDIQGKSRSRLEVLRDAGNDRQHRTITVIGPPKGVALAVCSLRQIIGDTAVIAPVELHRVDRQQVKTAAKPPAPHVARGGRGTAGRTIPSTVIEDVHMHGGKKNDGGGGHRAIGRTESRAKTSDGEDCKGRMDDRTGRKNKGAGRETRATYTAEPESDADMDIRNPHNDPKGSFAGPAYPARSRGVRAVTFAASDHVAHETGGTTAYVGTVARGKNDGFDGVGASINPARGHGNDEDSDGGRGGFAPGPNVNEEQADAKRANDMVERLHAASRAGGGQTATTVRPSVRRQQRPGAGAVAGEGGDQFHAAQESTALATDEGAAYAGADTRNVASPHTATGPGPSGSPTCRLFGQTFRVTPSGGDFVERGGYSPRQAHAGIPNNDDGSGSPTPPPYPANTASPTAAIAGAGSPSGPVNGDPSGLPVRQRYSSYRSSLSPPIPSGAFFETATGHHGHVTRGGIPGLGGNDGDSRKPPGFEDVGGGGGSLTAGSLPPVDVSKAETRTSTARRANHPSLSSAAWSSGPVVAAGAGTHQGAYPEGRLRPVPEDSGSAAAGLGQHPSHASVAGTAGAASGAATGATAGTYAARAGATAGPDLFTSPTRISHVVAVDPAAGIAASAAAAEARIPSTSAALVDGGAQPLPASPENIHARPTGRTKRAQRSPLQQELDCHSHQRAAPVTAEGTRRIIPGSYNQEGREAWNAESLGITGKIWPGAGDTGVGAKGVGRDVDGGRDDSGSDSEPDAEGGTTLAEAVRRQQQQLLEQVQEDRPHLEAVLKAAKCERLLPLLLERQIGLRKLAKMDEEDFKALEDEADPNTRVARGPQLKIRHHSKKMMEQLNMDAETEERDSEIGESNGDKDQEKDEGDSEGKCFICWEEEIEIIFVPCGHAACCIKCGTKLASGPCPICRGTVESAIRYFKG
ncbi:unnamed protein product [Scytosiphon promiscuus]